MSEDSKMNLFPWWAKIILGLIGLGALYQFYNLVEAMSLFFAIAAVPFGVLLSLNLISQGTYELFTNPGWFKDLKTRIRTFRDDLKTAETTPTPALS